MADHTPSTAPTRFVDGAGIRFAYRRFGKESRCSARLFAACQRDHRQFRSGSRLGYKIIRICLVPEEGFLLTAEKPAKGSFQIGMVRVEHVLAVQPMLRHVFQDQAVAQNKE